MCSWYLCSLIFQMYQIATEFASETSVKSLLGPSLRTASLCNASQFELSAALIDFHAVCVGSLTKRVRHFPASRRMLLWCGFDPGEVEVVKLGTLVVEVAVAP